VPRIGASNSSSSEFVAGAPLAFVPVGSRIRAMAAGGWAVSRVRGARATAFSLNRRWDPGTVGPGSCNRCA